MPAQAIEGRETPAARDRHVMVRTSPGWAAWLARLARHTREPRSVAIDKALALYARANQFPEPAPRR